MGKETNIAWCHHTFNPWRGCEKISAGCVNCYACTMAKRNPKVLGQWGGVETERVVASESYWRQPRAWDIEAEGAGERRRVFCGSMMDVFEERGDLETHRKRLWETIYLTMNLDWLLLTKRAESMHYTCRHWNEMPKGVWLGVTVEDQAAADRRIPLLAPLSNANVRFLSVEPMIGPINLGLLGTCAKSWGCGYSLVADHIRWVIVGCESGPNRRPMQREWLIDIIHQCRDADVPLFVKQVPVEWTNCDAPKNGVCHHPEHWPIPFRINRKFPK